jgi:hypothetical protein
MTSKILALSLLAVAAHAGAAPSVYPTGVTRYDTAIAYNSYVLFSGQDKKTHLIDMNGNEVHRWDAEGFPPVLLDPALTGGKRGNVLVQLASISGTSNEGNGLRNQAIGELDWDSNIVWQWGAAGSSQDMYGAPAEGKASPQVPGGSAKQHHDWRRLPNGHTLVLANLVHPVAGFEAPQAAGRRDLRGHARTARSSWQWVASEHLNEFGFSPESLKLVKNGYAQREIRRRAVRLPAHQ